MVTAIGFRVKVITRNRKSSGAAATTDVAVFASSADAVIIVRVLQGAEHRVTAIDLDR